MGHLVRYSSPEGEERYEDVADLDAAVERVEHLRNSEGVSAVRVYREVPLEFRTYVRVAVAGDEAGSSAPRGSGSTAEGSADASSRAPSSSDAPSGAAVISPPPASASPSSAGEPSAVQVDASTPEADVETRAAENRRTSLFNRGQAS